MGKSRRRRRFIDRQVQLALIFQVLKHWLLLLFVAFSLLTFLALLFGDSSGPFVEQVKMVWSRHAMFLVIALLVTPMFVYDVINLSHRFVGPVLRVRQELQRIAKGEPARPIVLRKNDFWKELATDFNTAMEVTRRGQAIDTTPLCNDQDSTEDQGAVSHDRMNCDTVDQDRANQDRADQDRADQEAELVKL